MKNNPVLKNTNETTSYQCFVFTVTLVIKAVVSLDYSSYLLCLYNLPSSTSFFYYSTVGILYSLYI